MLEVILTYPTPDGSEEIPLGDGRLSMGRGSEADLRFADDGLSRLHATVYREGDRVWVLDENSTNGTQVNGSPVSPSGTPLKNGDSIKIGHYTIIRVFVSEKEQAPAPSSGASAGNPVAVSSGAPASFPILPVALIAVAFLVIAASAVFIGVKTLGKNDPVIAEKTPYEDERDFPEDDVDSADKTPTPTPKTKQTPASNANDQTSDASSNLTETPQPNQKPPVALPVGKRYQQMTEEEKSRYVEARSEKVARLIGNRSGEAIPPEAVARIKSFVNGYASRANTGRLSGCRFGDNLQATLERASKNAPFIVRAFNEQGIDPQIGLYLAMIESEHCVCLQSPTGPLGMFQFTKATGENYGLKTIKGASPSNPDERCEPEPAAHAAAKYMKFLTGRYGTGPLSVPLAIGSYNSGEGGLSTNLKTALESQGGQERSFWTLIANSEKLAKQFQMENIKYVPKFFAAAIVGENPQDFSVDMQPLSTYTK
jgi:pSer/pThr/pTyr-binding forkhead associated (FHA) protein